MLGTMSPPQVSIIIPCMNEEKTIGSCIKKALSTLKQEKLEGEIIVSDNSTDNSREIARRMGAKVVIPRNKGYGNAYLKGLRHAQGRYVKKYVERELSKFFKIIDLIEGTANEINKLDRKNLKSLK